MKDLEAELKVSSIKSSTSSAGQTDRDSIQQSLGFVKTFFSRNKTHDSEQAQTGMELPSYTVPMNTTEQVNNEAGDQTSFYLLSCVDEDSSKTVLHQHQLRNINRDRELFDFMRSQYHKLNTPKRWLTIQSLVSLSLSQVRSYLIRLLEANTKMKLMIPSSSSITAT